MGETKPITGKYANADGYDAYMGGWSAKLAPLLLIFSAVRDGGTIVDLGCGTANLLVAAAGAFPDSKLIGVDPAAALLAKARKRPELSRATLLEGGVENIPLEDRSADYTLSLLVLQEFVDRPSALKEMRRITRPGGIVAACQWDFARMPVIDALVAAIDSVRPSAARSITANSPRAFADEDELQSCWKDAGLVDVETDRIVVERVFETFEHLWRPLLAGATPSTLTLAALSSPEQLEVRSQMEAILRYAGQPLKVTAEAMAVKGRS